jgi:hypothetical protein
MPGGILTSFSFNFYCRMEAMCSIAIEGLDKIGTLLSDSERLSTTLAIEV